MADISKFIIDETEYDIKDKVARESIDEVVTKLGSTDISSIGDGTISGAIAELYAMLTSNLE